MTVELTPGATKAKAWLPLRPKTMLFIVIGVMYVYSLWTHESFLFDKTDPEWAHIAPFRIILLPHGLAAAFALFLGPFQFSERLRRMYPMVHKTFGYLYIVGCYVGAPLGIYIQWFEERMGMSRNFTMAAVFDGGTWVLATTMALWAIRTGKMQQHRQWMIRSFTCAIVFLETRTIASLFQMQQVYIETLVWACVAAAYPIADLVLLIDENLRLKARRARA